MEIIFINTQRFAFVDDIIAKRKVYETRCRNTLGGLVGHRVFIAETGHGKPVVRCSAVIENVMKVTRYDEWEMMRKLHRVPEGCKYDWNSHTSQKYLYELTEVTPCEPFVPAEGKRHGRVWMESD